MGPARLWPRWSTKTSERATCVKGRYAVVLDLRRSSWTRHWQSHVALDGSLAATEAYRLPCFSSLLPIRTETSPLFPSAQLTVDDSQPHSQRL